MDAHKALYHQVRDTWLDATNFLIQGLGPLDPMVADLAAKECVFRINRDIRFSKDKSPYKTNMGAFLAPGGKKEAMLAITCIWSPKTSLLLLEVSISLLQTP